MEPNQAQKFDRQFEALEGSHGQEKLFKSSI
jgi:hypothetical protein